MRPLPPSALYRPCDPAQFSFATTADLGDPALHDGEDPDNSIAIVGQERAEEALRFGIGIRHQGYNIFALGPTGLGKHRLVRRLLQEQADKEPVPGEWCYVNNFTEPQKPRALRLPAGRGTPLRKDMERLIEELRVAIPAAFEADEYRARKQLLDKELEVRHEQTFDGIRQRASDRGLTLLRTPVGLALAPRGAEPDAVVTPEEFAALPEERRTALETALTEMQTELQEAISAVPRWQREIRDKERALNREVITHAVSHLLEDVRRGYQDLQQVLSYLDEVQRDLAEHVDDFLPDEDDEDDEDAPPGALPEEALLSDTSFRALKINVLTDHGASRGAPVVYEDHPTHPNIIGRVEHQAQYGALMTDFNLIRPGALHRANGGYLVLDARKLLEQPLAWEELKRALRSRKVKIESIEQAMSLVSTVSLEPEPIPLDVKVVLLGEPVLYYLLADMDPDFPALFKVAADFAEHVPRTPDNDQLFAQLLGGVARRKGLLPLRPGAVARTIEHAARLSEDAERLSTHLRSLIDLLCEADYFARREGAAALEQQHVQQAIDGQLRRLGQTRNLLLEEIRRGTLLIETTGIAVGQVNALTVEQLGSFSFGRPMRITAQARLGRGEVIDIERAVELGGPLHSKGVLILSGFLGARYAADHPLSLSASLVFEQSYGGVEGDSASLAELLALLSAISGLPARQDLALTGSVNQHGAVQCIGGVNEKIEGFFDVCQLRGLTGSQGVLIPAGNVKHLMLRQDVVDAVAQGRFHVYPIDHVDQALAMLLGVTAGERDQSGSYPTDTANGKIEARLLHLAYKARNFAVTPEVASIAATPKDGHGHADHDEGPDGPPRLPTDLPGRTPEPPGRTPELPGRTPELPNDAPELPGRTPPGRRR